MLRRSRHVRIFFEQPMLRVVADLRTSSTVILNGAAKSLYILNLVYISPQRLALNELL